MAVDEDNHEVAFEADAALDVLRELLAQPQLVGIEPDIDMPGQRCGQAPHQWLGLTRMAEEDSHIGRYLGPSRLTTMAMSLPLSALLTCTCTMLLALSSTRLIEAPSLLLMSISCLPSDIAFSLSR